MTATNNVFHVYVGTYGEENDETIQLLEFDLDNGRLRKIASATGIKNPSFLTVNQEQTQLYAVSEVENGQVVNINLDLSALRLTEVNRQSTGGNGPCYVTMDTKEEQLLTVNYGEGTTIVHSIEDDGSIGEVSDLKSYEGNQLSHPHAIIGVPDTDKYIVSDLGLNKLYLYQFNYDIAKLDLIKEIVAVADSGPRHLALEPKHRKLYVANEFNSKVSVYAYDEKVEDFELIQEIDTISTDYSGENYCADIHIAHTRSLLYVSNRGHHSLAVYKIMNDGTLEAIDYVSVNGEWPRNFAIVPNEEYILVANEHTNSIVVMEINDRGLPQKTKEEFPIQAPVCLKILPKK